MGPYGQVGKIVGELDDRLGVAKGGRVFLDKIFPDHWSFMLGEISLYSFVVLLATGVFLSLYFVPSTQQVIYHGSYKPLDGQWVSEAYKSTVGISFDVRGGLLIRQMHHWAADIFTGSIVVHMARIFFTGAFRKPRELNWLIGITMLILAILEGFIGYSLPDDLISGTGLRIGYSIAESIPFVGSYLVTFLWGGQFPGTGVIIPRFFIIHVLIIPLVLLGLLSAHLGLLVRQKHTQFKGEGRTEDNVVGSPMFPTFMAKTTGFLFMVTAATALLGAFAQINPIWQFGSYDASKISYAVQPDWYMGWLDGALRIMPSWELRLLGPHRPARGLPARRGLPRPHLHPRACCGRRSKPGDRRQRAAQPARPAAGQTQAHGRRRGHLRPAVHALRREFDRRPGQLLPRVAQRGALVLPVRGRSSSRSSAGSSPTSCAGRCRACTASGSASAPSSCAARPRASTRRSRRRPGPTTSTRSSTPSRCRCASTSSR